MIVGFLTDAHLAMIGGEAAECPGASGIEPEHLHEVVREIRAWRRHQREHGEEIADALRLRTRWYTLRGYKVPEELERAYQAALAVAREFGQ